MSGQFCTVAMFSNLFPRRKMRRKLRSNAWRRRSWSRTCWRSQTFATRLCLAPCTLLLEPCTLNFASWNLNLAPFLLHIVSASLHLIFSVIRRPGSDVVHVINGEDPIHLFRLFHLFWRSADWRFVPTSSSPAAILCHLFNIKDKSEISEHFKSQINYDAPRDFVKNKFRQN